MCFKDVLANRRKELNLTQKDLAEKLNVSNKTISKWENGGSYPDLPILIKLAEVLELNFNDLLVENGKTSNNLYEDVNKDIINKFKLNSFITYGFIILSFIISFNFENKFFTILFSISTMMSLILFVYNIINYRSYYLENYHTKVYEIIFYKYSIISLELYCLLCCSVIITSLEYFFDVKDFSLRLSILIISFTILLSLMYTCIIPNIIKKSNVKIRNDNFSKTLQILFLVCLMFSIIFILFNIIFYSSINFIIINYLQYFHNILLYASLFFYIIILNRYNTSKNSNNQ